MLKHKLESIIELWSLILKDSEFVTNAIDDLLVNLTEFFRNPDVWIKLRDQVIPSMPERYLDIWHAGCSTGEEVYTMNIVLETLGKLNRANLVATDLSSTALAKAKKGQYSLQVLQQYIAPSLKFLRNRSVEDYFDLYDKYASIKSRYQSNVTFQKHNLVMDSMIKKYDIIFCRNVMIYFDDSLKKRVLDLLHKSLKDDGYLIIGYYDIMPDYGKTKFGVYDIKTRIYKKILDGQLNVEQYANTYSR